MSIEPVKVGIAELKTVVAPVSVITTGLGSCVGVCIWDPNTKVGGLVHVMLPDSTSSKTVQNKAKYADTGVRLLIEEVVRMGCSRSRLLSKIAGGAQMFNFPGQTQIMRIGERNAEAVKQILQEFKIRILAEDLGGNFGRTIEFFPQTGELMVKTINKGQKVI